MWWHQHLSAILMGILAIPIVASILFALWLRGREKVDLETGSKCWDAFSKVIGAFTVIVTGAMLFGEYIEQRGALLPNISICLLFGRIFRRGQRTFIQARIQILRWRSPHCRGGGHTVFGGRTLLGRRVIQGGITQSSPYWRGIR